MYIIGKLHLHKNKVTYHDDLKHEGNKIFLSIFIQYLTMYSCISCKPIQTVAFIQMSNNSNKTCKFKCLRFTTKIRFFTDQCRVGSLAQNFV